MAIRANEGRSKNGLEDLGESLDAQGFRDDFVNLAGPGSLNVFILNMAGTGHDHGLWNVIDSIKVSNLLSFFEAIHDGHAYIRQDQPIYVRACVQCLLHFLDSFETVESSVNKLC